jgi:hypothetical protein
MKPRTREIIERCLEEGVRHGYRRAHKHVENPPELAFIDDVVNCIWLELDTYFSFATEED